jgi:hypothetical protein
VLLARGRGRPRRGGAFTATSRSQGRSPLRSPKQCDHDRGLATTRAISSLANSPLIKGSVCRHSTRVRKKSSEMACSSPHIAPAQPSRCAELAREADSAFLLLGPFLGHTAFDRRVLQRIASELQEAAGLARSKEQGRRGQAQ